MMLDDFYGVATIVAERKEYVRFLIISTQKSSYLLPKRMIPTASDTFDDQPHNRCRQQRKDVDVLVDYGSKEGSKKFLSESSQKLPKQNKEVKDAVDNGQILSSTLSVWSTRRAAGFFRGRPLFFGGA